MTSSPVVPGVLYRVTGPNGFDQLISAESAFEALVLGAQTYFASADQ